MPFPYVLNFSLNLDFSCERECFESQVLFFFFNMSVWLMYFNGNLSQSGGGFHGQDPEILISKSAFSKDGMDFQFIWQTLNPTLMIGNKWPRTRRVDYQHSKGGGGEFKE